MAEIITPEMAEIREAIIRTVETRNALKSEMEAWYNDYRGKPFPKKAQMEATDVRLSELDSAYKTLWDRHNAT